MLEVTQLTKKYGKTLAADHVTFAVPSGSIAVLLGPNGAGKSTVIKSVMGFLKYDGNVHIDGMDNKSVEAKRVLGYIPEIPALYPNLTVYEHMEFIARAYRLKNYKENIEFLLNRMELFDKKDKFGDSLSKGMQQKLSICLGLLPRPRCILFDEPMIGLDPHAIRELKNIFKELRDDGCTLLVSTHMIDSMEQLWDQTIILKEGHAVAQVRRGEMDNRSLEDFFFEVTEGGTP
ncbi:MAG: ABC transporter ATP-binding protein [Lachnospiraceae bacterium]|nr:ABC transporter ATP-binding protein [Lachnospiraceae bacterium]